MSVATQGELHANGEWVETDAHSNPLAGQTAPAGADDAGRQ